MNLHFFKNFFSSAKVVLNFAVFKDLSIRENHILWYVMNG